MFSPYLSFSQPIAFGEFLRRSVDYYRQFSLYTLYLFFGAYFRVLYLFADGEEGVAVLENPVFFLVMQAAG